MMAGYMLARFESALYDLEGAYERLKGRVTMVMMIGLATGSVHLYSFFFHPCVFAFFTSYLNHTACTLFGPPYVRFTDVPLLPHQQR